MTTDELKQKIDIILSQANPPPELCVLYGLRFSTQLLVDPDFIAEPGKAEITYEPLFLLRVLHSQCNPELQAEFIPHLLARLAPKRAWFTFHAVFAVGHLEPLKAFLGELSWFSIPVWNILDEVLVVGSHSFKEDDLDWIDQTASVRLEQLGDTRSEDRRGSLRWHATRVKRKIARLRYLRLRTALFEGQNPEINTDAKALVSRLETLGFRREIVEALNELDIKLYAAGKPLDFKGCMDLLRTIYEEMFEDAAKKVFTKRTRPLPHGGPFQPWRQYLENEVIITRDEGELSQKLYNYLSNAGTHQLGSEPEQVRVSRNMVIELGLMIVGRVQNLT